MKTRNGAWLLLRKVLFAVLAVFSLILLPKRGYAADFWNINLTAACGLPTIVDVHMPNTGNALPVVIMVHGGGWQYGSRADVRASAREISNWGFVVINVDYPVTNALSVPQLIPYQISSLRCVRSWVDHVAPYFRANAGRVGIIGHSAGAHLATTLALQDGPSRFQAYVAWGGKFDGLQLGSPYLTPYSPLHIVRQDSPPGLLIHGVYDNVIPWQEAAMFRNRTYQVGNPNITLQLTGGGHGIDTPYYMWWSVNHFTMWLKYR